VPRPALATPELPHDYVPRPYQQRFWDAMRQGCRYAALVWHRRAGKDTTAFNWLLCAAMQRVGTYYYVFPTFQQGRRVLWDGITDGQPFLRHVPEPLIKSRNETDMRIQLVNGSVFQIIGSDRYDDMRGPNPVGVVFSEYGKQHPGAWEVVAPIIRQNKGWAVFAYTPIGGIDNIGAKLYQMASQNPSWFCQKLTVDDTDGVFTAEDLAEERAAGMDEDRIGQEYYCLFQGVQPGAYYQKELQLARAEGRLGRFPYDPQYAVETAWDLGTKDATAIWFYQQVGRRVVLIDYFEGSGSNLIELNALVHGKRYGYRAGYAHTAPHDIRKTEFGSGKTPFEIARDLVPPLHFRVIPKMNPLERITAARVLLPRCYFDEVVCLPGIAALSQYHKEWDEETRAFALKPAHDWSSHGADAFGHLAVGLQDPEVERYQTQAVTTFDPYANSNDAALYRQGIRMPHEADPWAPQPTGDWDAYGR
jgi:hypothetical protein